MSLLDTAEITILKRHHTGGGPTCSCGQWSGGTEDFIRHIGATVIAAASLSVHRAVAVAVESEASGVHSEVEAARSVKRLADEALALDMERILERPDLRGSTAEEARFIRWLVDGEQGEAPAHG